MKTHDALVIPIAAIYHTGSFAIDGSMGVKAWEEMFGYQADFLDEVSERLGYDIWELL